MPYSLLGKLISREHTVESDSLSFSITWERCISALICDAFLHNNRRINTRNTKRINTRNKNKKQLRIKEPKPGSVRMLYNFTKYINISAISVK